jgi:hypothetical protein
MGNTRTGRWTASIRFVTFAGSIAIVVACSSGSTGSAGGTCTNDYSGSWRISGACTNTTCNVTQNASCGLAVSCADGTQGSGSLNGQQASLSGVLGNGGGSGNCSMAFNGSKGMTMTCSGASSTKPCTANGACESGACGAPIASGASGTSGASGSTSVACRQKADADDNEDCTAHAGKPRKLDCDASQTSAAVAAGCEPTKPDDTDVCCPVTVSGTTAGGSSGTSGSSGSSSGGTCTTNYSGTWAITGTCQESSCSVTQTGCALGVSCPNGTTLSGTISGTSAALSGTSQGINVTCTTKFNSASSFDLSCNVCSAKGTKGGDE